MDHIIYWIASLVISASLLSTTFRYYVSKNDYITRDFLQENINECSDFALYEMLSDTDDIQADYENYGDLNIDPQKFYDSFKRSYLLSKYGTDSYEAEIYFKNEFICGVLLYYDGYYIFDNIDHTSIKIPYVYCNPGSTYYSADDSERFLITLSPDTLIKVDTITGTQTTISPNITEYGEILKTLETTISRELSTRMYNYYLGKGTGYEVNIPFFTDRIDGIRGTTGITAICVFNDTSSRNEYRPLISISGSEVILHNYVIGYEREGRKRYMYLKYREALQGAGVTIDKLFRTKAEAAKHGYEYDIGADYGLIHHYGN